MDVQFVEEFLEKHMNDKFYNESKSQDFFDKAFIYENTDPLLQSAKF